MMKCVIFCVHALLLPVVIGAPPGTCLLQSGTRLASQGQSASVQASSLLEDFATSHASVLEEAIKENADGKFCFEDAENEATICIEKSNGGGVAERKTCSAPMENFIYPLKNCKKEEGCINENTPILSYEEAWETCGSIPECGAIMKWDSGGMFFLRRADDPDGPFDQHKRGRDIGIMFYKCRETCPPPGEITTDGRSFVSSPYRGCLDNRCLDDNREYDTFEQAWEACGQNQQCGYVSQYNKGGKKYYLRRLEDPMWLRTGAGSLLYHCPGPSVEEYEKGFKGR